MTRILIADTFLDCLAKLTDSESARAMSFVSTLRKNPRSPGISLERPHSVRSPAIWAGRISRDLRAIVQKEGDTWAVLYADHHDRAYDWAKRRQLGRHPVTGALQIVDTQEVVEEVRRVVEVAVTPEQPPLFAAHDDAYLLSLGVPESWLPTLRQVRGDDHLISVCGKLPPDVAERLLDLAAGELVTPPLPLPADRPADESPDTRRRFYLADDAFDLQAVLAAPLERWIAFLHPSQREIVAGDYRGPFKVSGAAGTGKTVVALHRARHLARRGRRVLLTSYVTTLCRNLERNLGLFCSAKELGRITVSTVHKQALDVVRRHDSRVHPAGQRDVADLLAAFGKRYGGGFEPELVRSEWEGVIEAQGLRSWPEYRAARRTGRGRPLSVRDRRALWEVYQAVLDGLRRRRLHTWAGLCGEAERLLAAGEVTSPFDAVVVDEVQDLRPPELRFLRRLAAAAPGRLMVVGDAGQRIYPGGFSLSALGIEVRGRARVLRLNYRTTEQIRRCADRVAGQAADDMDGGTEVRRSRSLLKGPEPVLCAFSNRAAELAFIVERLESWLAGGLHPEEIGVFARTARLIEEVAEALSRHGLAAHRLANEGGADQPGIHLGTMHRAKGLEFKAVLATSCSYGVLPNRRSLTAYGDPVDRKEAKERERRLLYVVMTRARDELVVTWVGSPSPLLKAVLG